MNCRFKTQRQYVENSEENLETKRQHCTRFPIQLHYFSAKLLDTDVEVVNAFESALALLNGAAKP